MRARIQKTEFPQRQMNPLELVQLRSLMKLSAGRPEIVIAIIDGPIRSDDPALSNGRFRVMGSSLAGDCHEPPGSACGHGSFITGMLTGVTGLCPECSFVLRPIFSDETTAVPMAKPADLANAISDVIGAGARIVNLSVALVQPTKGDEAQLKSILDYAARQRVIVVAAAGNHGRMGSTVLTRHPWLLPVVACDRSGAPLHQSDLGISIGSRGLRAPGSNIVGLGPRGQTQSMSGSSVATVFVTASAALLWSILPTSSAEEVKAALTQSFVRRNVVPPLLKAWDSYRTLAQWRKAA